MGKVLWIDDEKQLNKSHPGCISGIFHAFDYHHWLSKSTKRNRRYKRISNDDQDPFEVIKVLDTKTSHKLVDQDIVSSPKLQRTNSIHHLETNEWVHPIIFFPENVTESTMSSKTHVNLKNPEIHNFHDILDIFKVDKELFVNTLQNRSLSSDTKPKLTKLTKSGSYPSRNYLMPMKLKDKLNEIYTNSKAEKMKNSNDDVKCKNNIRLRRISSLNESATRFHDFSVGKEVTLRASRSLKLTNRSENLLRNDEGSRDSYFLRSFSQNERNSVSLSRQEDKYSELNYIQDCDFLNYTVYGEDAYTLKIEEDSYQISGEINQESPVLVREYCLQDKKVQISKGFQENVEEFKTINNKKHMKLSTKDDDFTYVKKILEYSRFINNGFQQTWYSSNQALDPFTFQEIESHYFHDPERFTEEFNALFHRLLIFDLVDEVLITIYGRSLTYYPKKLSYLSHICSDSIGSRVLDEVWNRVSRLLNFKHDLNESLNDIVSRDLRSDDGWMNLQLDCECVGLDLDDLILDEVLEEVVDLN